MKVEHVQLLIAAIKEAASQFVFGGKFHGHVGGIFPTFFIISQLSQWNFSYLFQVVKYVHTSQYIGEFEMPIQALNFSLASFS